MMLLTIIYLKKYFLIIINILNKKLFDKNNKVTLGDVTSRLMLQHVKIIFVDEDLSILNINFVIFRIFNVKYFLIDSRNMDGIWMYTFSKSFQAFSIFNSSS